MKTYRIIKSRNQLYGLHFLLETKVGQRMLLSPTLEKTAVVPFFGSWTTDPAEYEKDTDIKLLVSEYLSHRQVYEWAVKEGHLALANYCMLHFDTGLPWEVAMQLAAIDKNL